MTQLHGQGEKSSYFFLLINFFKKIYHSRFSILIIDLIIYFSYLDIEI
jgi:hypothetical protein